MSIKELRTQTGLSQRGFADKLGVPLSSLQHWEQGVSKPPKYVETLIEKVLSYDESMIQKGTTDGE